MAREAVRQSMSNFEPFIDWDDISDEMVADLAEAFERFRSSQEAFSKEKTKANAVEMLESQMAVSDVATAITHTLHTIPVMVHVAGPKVSAEEDDQEAITQRCTRCGSILQKWMSGYHAITPGGPLPLTEDDLPWWDEGDIVAKSGDEHDSMTMYEVDPKRELEKHERQCYSLDSLGLSG